MEYHRINYFLKAAQVLNFSKAAEELFISRQALTKQIALFEEELGVKLFERSTRNIRLTKAGQEAYKRLRRAAIEMDNALDAIRSLGTQETRPKVRIGFFAEIQKTTMSNIIRFIQQCMPDIELETFILEMFDVRKAMLHGKIDLGITSTIQSEVWDNCGKLVLRNYPPMVIVSSDHPWAKKESITVEDMLHEDFIMLKDEEHLDVEGFFENVPCRKQIWRPNTRSIGILLEQNKGFTVAIKYSSYFVDNHMTCFPMPESTELLEVSCMWDRSKPREVVDQIVDQMEKFFVK